jgi:transposase
MWTAENRGRYDRSKLRYPSDLTDEEWAHVEPLIPPGKGSMRRVKVREVMNGIMYILSTGCQWRAIPKDLPPRSTLFDYLGRMILSEKSATFRDHSPAAARSELLGWATGAAVS